MNTKRWMAIAGVLVVVIIGVLITTNHHTTANQPSTAGLHVVPADGTSVGNGISAGQLGPSSNSNNVQATPTGSTFQQTGNIQ